MPIVPFSTYTLNNDNAECWYVLVFDCTLGNFVFRNPCDFLTGCQLDLNNYIDRATFDWCQIVNSPLITDIDQPWYILRVNNTGTCIEAVAPNVICPEDFRVRCTAWDLEDYLQQKIVGTPNRVNVTLIPGVSQVLQIDIDNTLLDSILPANPSCVDPTYNPTWYAQLIYDNISGVHRECQQNRNDAYRHQRFLPADIVWNSWAHPRWQVWGTVAWANYRYIPCTGTEGLASMGVTLPGNIDGMWFNAVAGIAQNIPGIEIQESGLYAVRANVDVLISGDIQAIRFFLYTDNSKRMILNMKEATGGISLVPGTATDVTMNFSWYNYVKLNKWEYLFMGVRVYTPSAVNPFSMTVYSQAFPLAYPFNVWPSGNLCGTTFGCALVSKSILDAS